MKRFLTLTLTAIWLTTFSQKVRRIDSLKERIDNAIYTDSLLISDTSKPASKPAQITAFLRGDSLLKTIARYPNSSRLRVTYYQQIYAGYANAVYVKDVDRLTNKVLAQVYANDDNIVKAIILDSLNEQEIKYPHQFLQTANFSTAVGFALVDRKAKKYRFTGKLIEAVTLPPGCGTIAWATVQKFEVISTTFTSYNEKYVLLIQPCPELLGDGFFKPGKSYDIDVATNSGATFDYVVINNYKKEKLPTFWTREIKKAD